ncbi:unnamed protein product, partial [marine sediment metagenome]
MVEITYQMVLKHSTDFQPNDWGNLLHIQYEKLTKNTTDSLGNKTSTTTNADISTNDT